VKRWLRYWNEYWFPITTPLSLAGARIVAVAAQLFWFAPNLSGNINLAVKNTEFVQPQPLIRLIDALLPREVLFSESGLMAVYWATTVAGITALLGFFTRTSLFLLALGTWFFVSHRYSYADVHHPEALFAIFLMVLPFSPAGESLSIDALLKRRRQGRPEGTQQGIPLTDTAMWPLKLAHVLLAMTYFSTGISKLLSGGLAWTNGYTLQNHVFNDAIERNIPLGLWLAKQHTLCIVLGAGTILFELFYFLSLVLPRTAPYIFVSAIFFHIGLYLTSGHPFFQHIVLNLILLLFLDPHRFPNWLTRLREFVSRKSAVPQAHQAA
jgi:uncharacterized membrane protein YphA (DoxX/SURF4 family)